MTSKARHKLQGQPPGSFLCALCAFLRQYKFVPIREIRVAFLKHGP